MIGKTNICVSGSVGYKHKITGTSKGSGTFMITGIPFIPKGYAISASYVYKGNTYGQCGGILGNAYSYYRSSDDEYCGRLIKYEAPNENLFNASFSEGTLTVNPAAGSFGSSYNYSWAVVG